jgi:hypothetical protein
MTLQMINYSDKAVAIVGDTKEVKTMLKTLGGRFNRGLKCGSGWVFSKRKIEALREAFGHDLTEVTEQ